MNPNVSWDTGSARYAGATCGEMVELECSDGDRPAGAETARAETIEETESPRLQSYEP